MQSFRTAGRIMCAAAIAGSMLLLTAAPSPAQSGSEVSGTVTSASSQAPISGAHLELTGAKYDKTTTSDASGHFSFTGLSAGTYSLRAIASGYAVGVAPPFSVGLNEAVTLSVALELQSVNNLQTIARVRVNGAEALNTNSAPTVTITNRQFVAHGDILVQQALETQPGVTIEHYNGGLGSVATITIRGAGAYGEGDSNTGYEVLVLQDGEPLRNGQYGDFDLSTLTPAIYSRVELLKGVGGTSLFGANSIGGTLNLVTRDPMKTEGGEFLGGVGSFGFTTYDLSETDTIGRFGYVFNIHRMVSQGPIDPNFVADYTNYCSNTVPVCYLSHSSQDFNLQSGLLKLRYDFSPQTSLTLTGTSEADMRDQNGLQGNPNGGTDAAGYLNWFGYPDDEVYNQQPKISAELRTQVGGGDLMLRSYGGILQRLDWDLVPPIGADGTNNMYEDRSLDRLYGDEVAWSKILGQHTITLAAGANGDNFAEWDVPFGDTTPLTFDQLSLTTGGSQIERTYMVRDQIESSPKLRFDLAGYYSSYDTLNVKRFDPRLGIVYRPNTSTAVHASIASGFAAPRISDIDSPLDQYSYDASSDPDCPSSERYCVGSQGNPTLKPESSVGADVGIDRIFTADGRGRLSLDFYQTNLTNHIFNVDEPAPAGATFTDGSSMLFINTPENLAKATYSGFEFSGSLPVNPNFAVNAGYDTQAAYPEDVDIHTELIARTLVNGQQFFGVPVHKYSYGVSYENHGGTTGFINANYFGNNNQFNVSPFWQWNAGLALPLGENTLNITMTNIFNANAGIWSLYDAGIPYPGEKGPYYTSTHPSQPHMLQIVFDHRWGSLKNQ